MPKALTPSLAMILLIMICFSSAHAEERFGVPIYPRAKLDNQTTTFMQTSLKMQGAAYRTDDALAKVVAFYRGQKGMLAIAVGEENATFKKHPGINLTIQSPWQHMQTGTMMDDTLIMIVKGK